LSDFLLSFCRSGFLIFFRSSPPEAYVTGDNEDETTSSCSALAVALVNADVVVVVSAVTMVPIIFADSIFTSDNRFVELIRSGCDDEGNNGGNGDRSLTDSDCDNEDDDAAAACSVT